MIERAQPGLVPFPSPVPPPTPPISQTSSIDCSGLLTVKCFKYKFILGKVSRFCAVNGKWENANFVDCSSREFLRLGGEVGAD